VKGEKTENDKLETEEEGRWTMDDGREDERRGTKRGQKRSKLCKYINEDTFQRLDDDYEHIFAMLNVMENKVDTFCRPSS
jgi:hypothetical protein